MEHSREWQTSWPRPKLKPKWKQAEEYFKKERDGKVEITLPKVSILEKEEAA